MDQPLYERVEAAVAQMNGEGLLLYKLLEELSVARSMDDVNIAAGHASSRLVDLALEQS